MNGPLVLLVAAVVAALVALTVVEVDLWLSRRAERKHFPEVVRYARARAAVDRAQRTTKVRIPRTGDTDGTDQH